MSNTKLNDTQLEQANKLLENIRQEIEKLSAGDKALFFAYRRKIYKELSYDERGKPSERKKLKAEKRKEQEGNCAVCKKTLPETYAVLDRIHAIDGYTPSNTRLICEKCDRYIQETRDYD